MTTLPLMDCCAMLGIDPKTLRNWLKHANFQFAVHPADARLKCLTLEQVQQLAALHGRPLPGSSEGQAQILQEPAPTLIQKPLSLPSSGPEEEDLRQVLVSLESKVATMQEQLAGSLCNCSASEGCALNSASRPWKPSFTRR